jgi:hypothetical protein
MPNSNRNRNSQKGNENEKRTGNSDREKTGYQKLPDNPSHRSDESISTADNPANGKYSRTGKRDDEIDNDNTRGGR